jgi:hypothetical protein
VNVNVLYIYILQHYAITPTSTRKSNKKHVTAFYMQCNAENSLQDCANKNTSEERRGSTQDDDSTACVLIVYDQKDDDTLRNSHIELQ